MIFNLMKPVPVQTATMYSYNGTVLPALPEWDKEKYPYAYLIGGGDGCFLTILSKVIYEPTPFTSFWGVRGDRDCFYDGTAWREFENTGYSGYVDNIFWANFDVLNEDGSIFLEASEPVPIYE